jgi:hypothetical protein
MMENDSVQREIIAETLESAESGQIKESGRTVCGRGSIRGPLGRYPTSVKLDSCPKDRGGTWHTHVTPEEIRSPQNSLPDMANVVFGYIDASIVAGTDTSEAFIRAANPDATKDAFAEAIGVPVSRPEDVTNAVMSGDVNPQRARQRVRRQLSPLFIEDRNNYTNLVSRVPASVNLSNPGSGMEMREARMYHPHFRDGPASLSPVQQMSESMDEAGKKMISAAQGEDGSAFGSIKGLAVSSAVGTVVGEVVTRVLFE